MKFQWEVIHEPGLLSTTSAANVPGGVVIREGIFEGGEIKMAALVFVPGVRRGELESLDEPERPKK